MPGVAQELIGLQSRDHAAVPRKEESVNAALFVRKQSRESRRHEFVQGKDAEVFQSFPAGRQNGSGHCGRCRFKADTKEDHSVPGIFPRDLQGIQGRVDNAHSGSFCEGVLEAAAAGAGNAQEIAEGRDNHVVLPGHFHEGGHLRIVGNADRASGTGEMNHAFGKEGAQAALEDGNSVGAADFHEAHAFPVYAVEGLLEAFEKASAENGIAQEAVDAFLGVWLPLGFLHGGMSFTAGAGQRPGLPRRAGRT